jgi:PAS domain S-box-containing protein
MDDEAWDRFLGGIVVSALGAVLTAVTLFDIYEDAALQGDPLYSTLFENAVPLGIDLVLIVAGGLIVADRLHYAEFARRITAWSVFGGAALLAITGWVYYFQLRQGVIKPLIIFAHVVAMGALAGLLIGVYDGSRLERESELRIERDRTSTLFKNSTDCIAAVEFVDDRPVVRQVNESFCRTFEVSEAEIVGRQLDDVIVPPEREADAARINEKAKQGRHLEDEVFRQTASGETRVFRLQAIPLETAAADIDGYAVYTDITETHRYEARMTALHDATRVLIDANSIEEITDRAIRAAAEVLDVPVAGVFLYESDTDRLEPAVQTERATELVDEPDAFERDEAIAWTVFETGEPEYVRDVHARSDAYADDSPIRSELILPLGEWGVLLLGSESVDAFDDSEYSLSRTLAANVKVAMDRTERRQEIEAQNERLDTFASVVSHDLRNPLSVARGFLELAREDDPEALDRIEDALDRMDRLIDTLLALARSGEAIREPEAVSIEDATTAAWRTVETDGSALDVDIEDGAAETVRADPQRLRQLLENLFRNSVEHGSTGSRTQSDDSAQRGSEDRMPAAGDRPGHGSADSTEGDGPGVAVRVRRFPGGFAVEDDGSGLPERDREEIFEHGYTTADDGTGLGLAIVREIADAHGWSVSVGESDFGGARFEFGTSGA